ncbi:MAG: hypothetical protein OXG42_08615 [Chloroflexi bacterium]|nr:hypothetical protein [Chloroflexota bacterium]
MGQLTREALDDVGIELGLYNVVVLYAPLALATTAQSSQRTEQLGIVTSTRPDLSPRRRRAT